MIQNQLDINQFIILLYMHLSRQDPQQSEQDKKLDPFKDKLNRKEKTWNISQQIKLYMRITPKEYRGMHLLGNFKQENKWRQKQKGELRDLRVDLLDQSLFRNKRVLDVGCGDGKVAIEIAVRFFPVKMVALDIDEYLLSRAARLVEKLVERSEIIAKKEETVLKKIDEMPLFFQQQYAKNKEKMATLSKPKVEIAHENQQFLGNFPNNFYIMNENIFNMKTQDQKYDTIILMNTSKWIHLAFGDVGITSLFEKCADALANQGFLILEYPLEPSYRKKKTMNCLYKQNVQNHIKIDPISFPNLLLKMNLQLVEQYKSSQKNRLRHPMALFKKIEATQ